MTSHIKRTVIMSSTNLNDSLLPYAPNKTKRNISPLSSPKHNNSLLKN